MSVISRNRDCWIENVINVSVIRVNNLSPNEAGIYSEGERGSEGGRER